MVENLQGIGKVTIKTTAKCYCPLGKDWYTNKFKIDFEPHKLIPDYCELDRWIEEHINGKSMIIEDAVNNLYCYLVDEYKPNHCSVTSDVDDAKHCAVIITK